LARRSRKRGTDLAGQATRHLTWRRLAVERGVLCLPATFFGPRQEPYLRIAFANLEVADIEAIVARLEGSRIG
jgi:hypothetical protein